MRVLAMIRGTVLLAAGLCLAGGANISAQVTMSTNPVADAFVRSLGSNVNSNFGGGGALSVSGLVATNASGQQQGQFDTFMRFDVSSAVSTFNSTFGAGQWVITNATLSLIEQGAPANAIFNRGVGQFEVRWIANDTWLAGTGQPMPPTTNGIVWADEPSVLNSNVDLSLGTFVNGGTNGLVKLSLGLPGGFLSDISTGTLVSLYFTAPTNSPVGFTFN